MPDAPTISALASVIGVLLALVVVGCLLRLLRIQGTYNKLLRDTLDVYDPEKVNKRMRAIKEQAELAAEATVKELQRELEGSRDSAVKHVEKLATRYGEAVAWLAMTIRVEPLGLTFKLVDRFSPDLKRRVQALLDTLP